MRDDWIEIVPGTDGLEATAADLLVLARHPGDVRTAGAGDTFIVPPYLAALYAPAAAPEPVEAPAPKRRRTKKEEE